MFALRRTAARLRVSSTTEAAMKKMTCFKARRNTVKVIVVLAVHVQFGKRVKMWKFLRMGSKGI